MSNLTKAQLEFLKLHDISLDLVFNANGLTKDEYRVRMKQQGKIVAFNVVPCKEGGHTLRTRSGHCIQCNPARLAFQKRNESGGVVYIAGTKTGQVIKVGFSKAVEVRDESLNRTKYAGFNDWEILFAIKSESAGKMENEIKIKLRTYSFKLDYDHDGHNQEAGEIYLCPYSQLKRLIFDLIERKRFKYQMLKNIETNSYEKIRK